VEIIGSKKLEQAMKIYEKFKENEIDVRKISTQVFSIS
jgi:hypothetical protein